LLLRLVFGLAYAATNPLGEAPDEADHFAYAAYIANEGGLPVGPGMTQGKHPPLYHAIAAVAGRIAGPVTDTGFLRANPDGGVSGRAAAPNFFIHTSLESWPWRGGAFAMHLGRWVSVLAGVGLVAATYALGRALWPGWPWAAFAGAAFSAFLPESLFIGASVSNDMLAAMLSAGALWAAAVCAHASHSGNRRRSLWALLAGLALGLAFLTKASTGTLAFVVVGAIVAGAWPRGRWWPGLRALGLVSLSGGAALAVALPWLLRNRRLYGDFAGWELVLSTIDRRTGTLTPADIMALAQGWWLGFWGKFGAAGHIALPPIFYAAWLAIGLLALTGWVRWLAGGRRGLVGETSVAGAIILLGAPLVTAVGILSYSRVALGTDQGRLLFPALAPIALLVAGGAAAWAPAGRERSAALLWSGGMAVLAASALLLGVLVPFGPPPPPADAEVAAATPVDARFGDSMELVAADWVNGETALLLLYWRRSGEEVADLRTSLRLLAANGNLIWEWKRSPGAGRYSTDRWLAGATVGDAYTVPGDALEKASRAVIGLRPFPEGTWLPTRDGDLLNLPSP
jgi:4-amino-4-deoxy-L-arabinose transferase-like glycosyltransferase